MNNRCFQFIVFFCILLLLSVPFQTHASSNPVINEFMPNPESDTEWIEFYNPDQIDLTSYYIDDDTDFDDDIGSSKKSLADLEATDTEYPYIKLKRFLNDAGDFVVLFDPEGNIIDEYEYKEDPGEENTIGRSPDGKGDFFVLNQSTKGSSNSQPKPTQTPIPSITPIPTKTPKPPTPTKVPTPTKTPTPTKIDKLSKEKLLSLTPSKNKVRLSPSKVSSRSASQSAGILGVGTKSATLIPSGEDMGETRKNNNSSSIQPLIFSIIGAVLFIACAILVALKIKWK